MRLIIAGGRDFQDYATLKEEVMKFLAKHHPHYPFLLPEHIEIVSGCAIGADSLGITFAKEMGYHWKEFKTKYKKYPPKIAPKIRNTEMAEYGTHLIAFWDSKSTGTDDMIKKAAAKNLVITIVSYQSIPKS